LLDSLASTSDRVWPAENWPPMRFDRPLSVGAVGGHGPIRYTVVGYEPGRRVRFRFDAPAGFDGYHEFRVDQAPTGGASLIHELRIQTRGTAVVTWPLIFRPLHDALVEDGLAKAAVSVGEDACARPWSLRVRLLRSVVSGVLTRRRSPQRPPN
jgi:hypothetical protein